MQNFFSSNPRCSQGLVTIGDVLDQMTAFNALYEVSADGSVNNCADENLHAQWRDAVREGVINCQGMPIDIDFFNEMTGSTMKEIDATDFYIKSNCDIDHNVTAAGPQTGGAPGAAVTFTLSPSEHFANGTLSNVSEAGSIYLYEDEQWLYVTDKDTTTPYAHTVTVRPYSQTYTIQIPAGQKMLFSHTRVVGGTSCPKPSVTWVTNGYIAKAQAMRIRSDWAVDLRLDRSYKGILQFAIMFDKNGRKIDGFELAARQKAREDLRAKENLQFFIGQSITNTAMLADTVDSQFPGFDGYEPTIKYGGGVVYDYDQSTGFSFVNDFTPIMIRQDARKKSQEFVMLAGYQFRLSLNNRGNKDFMNNPGECTFDSFKREGATSQDIKKLGIDSFNYAGSTVHVKTVGAFSDQRYLGNYNFPNKAFLMPTQGLTDSNGNAVSPIERYQPARWGYEEHSWDNRDITGCETKAGYVVKTIMQAIHCPDSHFLINPKNY